MGLLRFKEFPGLQDDIHLEITLGSSVHKIYPSKKRRQYVIFVFHVGFVHGYIQIRLPLQLHQIYQKMAIMDIRNGYQGLA